jgi:hypothetical protein
VVTAADEREAASRTFALDPGEGKAWWWLLFVLSPAGMEGLIREMGEPARSLTVPPRPEEPPD